MSLIKICVDFLSSLAHSDVSRVLQVFLLGESFIFALTDVHMSIPCQNTSVQRAHWLWRPQAFFYLLLDLCGHSIISERKNLEICLGSCIIVP